MVTNLPWLSRRGRRSVNVRRIRRTASLVTPSVVGAWPATSFAVSSARRCSIATSGHHLVEQTERQRLGGLDHRAVKIRSLVRAGPTREASRLIFDIDRQLPSVRAIGKPIRLAAVPIQMSQNRPRSPRHRQCRRRRWPRSSAPGSFPARPARDRSAPRSRAHPARS
jgi:hypothetical protein